MTNPIHRRKPHLMLELPSSFRLTLESYFSELQKLSMTLFGLMAEALKMDKIEIEGIWVAISKNELLSSMPVARAGLQIKKDGVWLPVKFLPDAFVVNLGDIMEILSNGLYYSIEHRATVNSTTERISIAMFINPKIEGEVGPALSVTNSKNRPLFKRVLQEYSRDFFSRKLNGKFFLEQMKIKTGQGQPN
ncbi:LOW QUALITY PROTEIN: hypothetical protein RJ639_011465 [Escallonia herrerae]|uniref:Isopenicillin N synthase-like Fe(2+) 2OG dioxygenase domain-containing protein n=1 Tax=Escallonia herrerae TaxID=1293975 RepID=A0AA88VM66_9ASTE|nr:LOW QUALITY PROTEIN: hypothetical protein RJ639_011465 [Escallonia herrerae]